MIEISPAIPGDEELLFKLGRETFIESHLTAAPATELEKYVSSSFSVSKIQGELGDAGNIFHIARWNDEIAGYSKIIPNCPNPLIATNHVTKLERLYIKQEFYGKKLGLNLFQLNLELSKSLGQRGIWLNVWVGNSRAIDFYRKAGFAIIGETLFKLSETRSNPNHWMFLSY